MPICLPSAGGPAYEFDPASQTCAGLVALSHADVPPNPFLLSIEDGLLVSGAIWGVWLLAWTLKAIRSVLDDKTME